MKLSQLKKDKVYIQTFDKKLPLVFTGKVEKNVNIGFNCYVNVAYFKPVKTEQNKNWFNAEEITLNFDSENDLNKVYLIELKN